MAVELKRPRGFYVKMKLQHKNTKQQEIRNQFFCFKYYKYILWFSLTLYFFTSYLISHKPLPPPISKSHIGNSQYRSLYESNNDYNNNNNRLKMSMQKHPLLNLKLFIYNLPSRYNEDWLTNKRCENHLFGAEVAIHKALLKNDVVRTFDPYEADFFYVPVYVACNFSSVNGFPAIGHARGLISSAIQLLSSNYPFWNRTNGSDHVFVASHDYGACFHAMEHRAIADGIPDFLKNSIVLQTFGVKYKHPCKEVENVVIPPYVSPESIRSTLEETPLTGERDIWVYFRGKMEVHPKNISGRFYSKRVRTAIWRRFNNDRRFYLQRQRFAGFQSEIVRSVFCLCPLGWAPWSPRLVESVALGCVPVIIADGIQLPFPDAIRWSDISLTVAEKDVTKLDKILEHVVATNLSIIQQNLWDLDVRRGLLFNDRMQEGDATWQVLYALTQKLDRSMSRRRSSPKVYSE